MINLNQEEAKEIFTLPTKERFRYIIAAEIKEDVLFFIRGNGAGDTIDLSFFTPSGTASPDFDRLEIVDHGKTIKFGEYEADVEAIFYEIERKNSVSSKY